MITVAYITAPSREGRELFSMLKPALEKAVWEKCGEQIDWAIINHPDYPNCLGTNLAHRQSIAFNCCYGADLVIFDGSLEDKNIDRNVSCFKIDDPSRIDNPALVIEEMMGMAFQNTNNYDVNAETTNGHVCSQYEYALLPMTSFEHVLIVSRSKLPYNFEGFRKGGAPSWLRSHIVSNEGKIKKETFKRTNSDITDWILKTLHCIELPRENKEIPQTTDDVVDKFLEKKFDRAKDERHDIFVSYLSRESRFLNNPEPIEKFLLDKAASIIKGTGDSFIYAPPGDLSNELMTEQRRWELVSMIDRQMHQCKAVLLYMTDGYLRSWWTFAELICLAYRVHYTDDEWSDGWNPTIYVVSQNRTEINKLSTYEEMEAFLPKMTQEQCDELVKRFSSSDPSQATPEWDEAFSFEKIPNELKERYAEIASENLGYSKERILASLNSYVQTDDFRKKLVVECKECGQQNDYTVDDFIRLRYSHRISLQENKLPCGHKVKIKDGGIYYRYLPPRFGVVVNKEGCVVKPVYAVEFDNDDEGA